jgi:putative transposase
MQVSKSAYYDGSKRPAEVISADILHLYRCMKQLFKESRKSPGSRKMMKKLSLVVTQRVAYKATTKRKHSDTVADNLAPDEVWAGDVIYLKTGEGWMYLSVVMDLYSRRIVGWHIDKRMTTERVSQALIKAYNLRRPGKGLVFHSDRGSQYTSKHYRKLVATAMECAPVWVTLVLVGTMRLWNVFLVV